ncbi:MAG: hypothetical protein ACRC1R_05560 [Cetobacterium sp.]|uniref:hypothetical protein n=1 Tax=Cetobacterium sp. TaxID=2071632 RepID=UPI003F3D2791
MSSEQIQLAILCPVAAKNLIAKDENFIIYGEMIKNGTGIIYRKNNPIKKVAFANGRIEQLQMIEDILGKNVWVKSAGANGLPYLLENNSVDAIVTDYGRYLKMGSNYEYLISKNNYVTHVLVINKNLLGNKKFNSFIKTYNSFIKTIKKGEKKEWMPIYTPLELKD